MLVYTNSYVHANEYTNSYTYRKVHYEGITFICARHHIYIMLINSRDSYPPHTCSGEGLDYRAMGSTFSGLVQVGAWGCFVSGRRSTRQ